MLNPDSKLEILTLKQVAKYLQATDSTIYRLATEKKIPAFKVVGMWSFRHTNIGNWIKQESSKDEISI
jgi:excisionase family DNA binding protein